MGPHGSEETKIGQESNGRQKWLLKCPGNANPLNKGMGCQWWETGARLQGGKNDYLVESRSMRGKEYPGSW